VNNNKPGEFVSSSGNFFDLASYFFGRGCDHRAGCAHARACDAGLADTLGLEENSLALACNRTGCEATGKQKLPAHVTSVANAEAGGRIVGVPDSRQAPKAMNILL
jgi:hypothetical protein